MRRTNLFNKIEEFTQGLSGLKALSLFMLVTLSAYIYTLNCGYIWDDERHVLMDSSLWGLAGLWKIWFTREMQQYYPLIYSSFWLESNLWGLSPALSHLINAAFHALNAFLIYAVLKHLNVRGALFAGLIFALHPVHVESVAWISERKNVLSGFFYLLSLYAFLKSEDTPEKKGLYILSLVLFVMALLCKTVACTLPVALIIIRWMRGRDIRPGYIAGLIPFFALGLAFGLLTVWWEANLVGASGQMWELSYIERALLAGRIFWFYLYKLLAPFELIFIYPRWQVDSSAVWQWLPPAGAVLSVALLLALSRWIGRRPFAAMAFFLVTLFPALGFIDVYPFQFSFVADHFQYIASAGPISLFAGMAVWAARRCGKTSPATGMLAAVVLLAALWALSFNQTFAYKDSSSIWNDTIAKNPNAWIAHTNLAVPSISTDQDFAITHLEKAYGLNPSNETIAHALGLAFFEKSRKLSAKDMEAEALEYNGRAIALFKEALALEPRYATAHINLGASLANAEDYDGAIKHFQIALRLQPSKTFVRKNIEHTMDLKALSHPLELKIKPGR